MSCPDGTTCTLCKDGFGPKDGDGNCEACSTPNCIKCSNDKDICEDCEIGYFY